MDLYKESVQGGFGPHWTNSGYQLTCTLDPDADKIGAGKFRRVSAELLTLGLPSHVLS